MPCQSCEQRKARLQALAEEGTPLPSKDWAFYGTALVAVLAVGYIVYSRKKGSTT